MAFVVSEGSLRTLEQPVAQAPYALRLTDDLSQDYATIWRSQQSVRTVVSFLARNIASLGLHTFRRLSDTDRERLVDHPLAQLLSRPNPFTTRYRLIDAIVHDLGIYDNAYLLKFKAPGFDMALVRIPPEKIKPTDDGWLAASRYVIEGNRGKTEVPADQIIHLRGYSPGDPRLGCSPLESLRRILVEEYEAGRMREQVLRNGARTSGYLERPAAAPAWSDKAKQRFRASWQSQYAGSGPSAGGTPILEDGMKFVPAAMTAEQLQYVEGRKLTREEVASAYFIPPPMVGILDHATFGNIEEQHKMLYQDTLGPWLTMLVEDLQLQLLPDFADQDGVYLEFNLAEKLKGSFEEQAAQLQTSVGAPWLSRNEARARMNLPQIEGGDELVTPLNVLVGGQTSPRDSAPKDALGALLAKAGLDADEWQVAVASKALGLAGTRHAKARAPETHETKHREVLEAFFKRQAAVVKSKLGAKATGEWWDQTRWNDELAADLYRLAIQTSETVAKSVVADLGFGPDEYDVDRTLAFLAAVAERVASAVNAVTKAQLDQALAGGDIDAVASVFEVAIGARAAQIATTSVTQVSGFGATEGAKQVAGGRTVKTWNTGTNPRSTHAAMNGETVGIEEKFSNGMDFPGDSPNIHETAGCNCSVTITNPPEEGR